MSALARWRSEKLSAWLYRVVADREDDPTKAKMFRALAEAAEEQAAILLEDAKRDGVQEPPLSPRPARASSPH
jgi:hypothetical protein